MHKLKDRNIQLNLGIYVIPRCETETYRKKASVSENSNRNDHIKFNSARSSPRGMKIDKIPTIKIHKNQVGKLFQKSTSFQNLSKGIKISNINNTIESPKNTLYKKYNNNNNSNKKPNKM